ncbi:hypothetical protein H696_04696 [Fonticula alba]|uniref:Uncharacterized protein n=1 Tax=Fonticula alba TaxID=691883 RepID=A0A058Z2P6_FONAL|nr:hypothetical protein H696_04696 [Fonticula alba]KCV68401.1 hypothetical protein H696_04696 [Fonticula alba]|eukprot:XP_009496833.1 hypothetical protein H696_04696 [Fonticula alba]
MEPYVVPLPVAEPGLWRLADSAFRASDVERPDARAPELALVLPPAVHRPPVGDLVCFMCSAGSGRGAAEAGLRFKTAGTFRNHLASAGHQGAEQKWLASPARLDAFLQFGPGPTGAPAPGRNVAATTRELVRVSTLVTEHLPTVLGTACAEQRRGRLDKSAGALLSVAREYASLGNIQEAAAHMLACVQLGELALQGAPEPGTRRDSLAGRHLTLLRLMAPFGFGRVRRPGGGRSAPGDMVSGVAVLAASGVALLGHVCAGAGGGPPAIPTPESVDVWLAAGGKPGKAAAMAGAKLGPLGPLLACLEAEADRSLLTGGLAGRFAGAPLGDAPVAARLLEGAGLLLAAGLGQPGPVGRGAGPGWLLLSLARLLAWACLRAALRPAADDVPAALGSLRWGSDGSGVRAVLLLIEIETALLGQQHEPGHASALKCVRAAGSTRGAPPLAASVAGWRLCVLAAGPGPGAGGFTTFALGSEAVSVRDRRLLRVEAGALVAGARDLLRLGPAEAAAEAAEAAVALAGVLAGVAVGLEQGRLAEDLVESLARGILPGAEASWPGAWQAVLRLGALQQGHGVAPENGRPGRAWHWHPVAELLRAAAGPVAGARPEHTVLGRRLAEALAHVYP